MSDTNNASMKTAAEIVERLRKFVTDLGASDEAVIALEAGKECRIECGRSGTFTDMHGKSLTLDGATMSGIAERFDQDGYHKLKLGHVEIKSDSPDYGDVTRLEFDAARDRLVAFAVPTEITVEKNRKEGFKRASMELTGETVEGPWHFKHLSLLGARRPAIPGLAPIALAEQQGEHVFVFADGGDDEIELYFRQFDAKARKDAAKSGAAMPDGSFPIENEQDLKNAIQAIGRAKDPEAAKAHIRKRAKALGLTDLLPESWKGAKPLDTSDNFDPETKETQMSDELKAKLEAQETENKRLRKQLADGARGRVKAFLAENVKRIPLKLKNAGLEDGLTEILAAEAGSSAPVSIEFSAPDKEGKAAKVSQTAGEFVMHLLANLPEQTTREETTETARNGAEDPQPNEDEKALFAGADPDSVEYHLAVQKEILDAKAKGQEISYLEGVKRVERVRIRAAR
jgi:hypothetical protein